MTKNNNYIYARRSGQEKAEGMLSDEWKTNLSKEEIDARLEAWGLDDSPDAVVRFKPKRGDTELVHCRIDSRIHHRIMMILAQQYDPKINTFSAAMHDATAKWVEQEEQNFPDGPSGDTLLFWSMERRKIERESRREYISSVDSEIDEARSEGDHATFTKLLSELHWKLDRCVDDPNVPRSFVKMLEDRIDKVKREV